VEGGLGDLTLRRPGDAQALRWRFQAGAWSPAPLPAERHAVSVTAQETYEVGALLARMRAALVADRRRFRTLAGRLDVDLHIQADQGPGADLGYTFTFFEKAGEPEEVLQKQVRFNGVEANLGPGLQLPIIESRAGLAPPVALGLTEHYRYRDGGSGSSRWTRIRCCSGVNCWCGKIPAGWWRSAASVPACRESSSLNSAPSPTAMPAALGGW
jgi:hypothetical protein